MKTLFAILIIAIASSAFGAEWYVSPQGRSIGLGTKSSPWDIESTLAGHRRVRPGDTVWLMGGVYRCPDRAFGTPGYRVKLRGSKDKPIHVRPLPKQRVIIDGGIKVYEPTQFFWLWDVEILVSENYFMSHVVKESGSYPKSYGRLWGGLTLSGGNNCKYINIIVHHCAQGIYFWMPAKDSELYGCIIYDNGWKGPDRGHGHAIYSMNNDGIKSISDCIMTGGYSYTMHAYGQDKFNDDGKPFPQYVNNYLIQGNVAYNGGDFLIGGELPSRNIGVFDNYLYNVDMRIGYGKTANKNCDVRNNTLINGDLRIINYEKIIKQGNQIIRKGDPRPIDMPWQVKIRPNKYDTNRANVIIMNWSKSPVVKISLESFLKIGDNFRLMNPRDFFGEPIVSGTFEGKSIAVPVGTEFAVFVMLKDPR